MYNNVTYSSFGFNSSVAGFNKRFQKDEVEDRFKNKYLKENCPQTHATITKALKLHDFVLSNLVADPQFFFNLRLKNAYFCKENVPGKVYALSLKIIKFLSDGDSKRLATLLFRLSFKILHQFSDKTSSKKDLKVFLETNVLIGHGTYCQVFKGYDLVNSNEIVVRNVLDTSYEDWVKTIYHHKILSEKDTPHIVKICSVHPDIPTLFLEKFDNDLSKLSSKSLSNLQILNLMLQIGTGIRSIHNQDLIVRDIKLENVLYKTDSKGNIFASHCDLECVSEISQVKKPQGTVKYTPIDAFNTIAHVDRRKIDSWAFGLCLLLFVSGCQCNFNSEHSTELFLWAYSQADFLLNNNLIAYFKYIETEIQDLTNFQAYKNIKNKLNTKKQLDKSSENDLILCGEIVSVLIQKHPIYSLWLSHYESVFSILEKKTHPLISIILGLMNLNVEKRFDVSRACDELHSFILQTKDSDAHLSSLFEDLALSGLSDAPDFNYMGNGSFLSSL